LRICIHVMVSPRGMCLQPWGLRPDSRLRLQATCAIRTTSVMCC
jgi:hypothetical protein